MVYIIDMHICCTVYKTRERVQSPVSAETNKLKHILILQFCFVAKLGLILKRELNEMLFWAQ